MPLQRITHLTAPPVVGKAYLVPTVHWPYLSRLPRDWPVFMPRHEDAEILDFPWPHYHVDPRFVGARDWALLPAYIIHKRTKAELDHQAFDTAQRNPISAMRRNLFTREILEFEAAPPKTPTWRRLICKRDRIDYVHHDKPTIQALKASYAGRQCKHARTGWVCPHKNFPLGSIAPDADGAITCPLHGLRIDAASGKVRP